VALLAAQAATKQWQEKHSVARSENAEIHKQYSRAMTLNADQESMLSACSDEIVQLQTSLDEREQQLRQLECQVSSHHEQLLLKTEAESDGMAQLAALEAANSELEQQLAKLQGELSVCEESLAVANMQSAENDDVVIAMNAEIESLKNEVREHKLLLAEGEKKQLRLQTDLKASVDNAKALTQQIKTMNSQLEVLKKGSEIAELTTGELELLQTELREHQRVYGVLSLKHEQLQGQMSVCKEQYEFKLKEVSEDLKLRTQEKDSVISELATVRAEITAVDAKYTSSLTQIRAIQEELKAAEEAHRSSAAAFETEIESMKNKQAQHQVELASYTTTYNASLAMKDEAIASQCDIIATLENQWNSETTKVQQLESSLAAKTAESVKLFGRLQTLEQTQQEHTVLTTLLNSEILDLQEQLQSAEQVRVDKELANIDVTSKEAEIAVLKSHATQQTQQLEALEAGKLAAETEKQTLSSELQELKLKFVACDKELSVVKLEFTQAQELISDYHIQLVKFNGIITAMKESHRDALIAATTSGRQQAEKEAATAALTAEVARAAEAAVVKSSDGQSSSSSTSADDNGNDSVDSDSGAEASLLLQAQAQLESQQEQGQQYRTAIAGLEAEVASLQTKQAAYENKIDRYRAQIRALEHELRQLTASLEGGNAGTTVTATAGATAGVSNAAGSVEARLMDLSTQNSELSNRCSHYQAQYIHYKELYTGKCVDLESLLGYITKIGDAGESRGASPPPASTAATAPASTAATAPAAVAAPVVAPVLSPQQSKATAAVAVTPQAQQAKPAVTPYSPMDFGAFEEELDGMGVTKSPLAPAATAVGAGTAMSARAKLDSYLSGTTTTTTSTTTSPPTTATATATVSATAKSKAPSPGSSAVDREMPITSARMISDSYYSNLLQHVLDESDDTLTTHSRRGSSSNCVKSNGNGSASSRTSREHARPKYAINQYYDHFAARPGAPLRSISALPQVAGLPSLDMDSCSDSSDDVLQQECSSDDYTDYCESLPSTKKSTVSVPIHDVKGTEQDEVWPALTADNDDHCIQQQRCTTAMRVQVTQLTMSTTSTSTATAAPGRNSNPNPNQIEDLNVSVESDTLDTSVFSDSLYVSDSENDTSFY
jgi:chromosome segregation ATPase